MNLRHLTSAFTALVLTGTAVVATTAPAQTAEQRLGTRSLAKVLAADGNRFDQNWQDFDILDRAIRLVLAAKPGSPLAVLKDGRQRLTAFAPTDQAFRRLAQDVGGQRYGSERAVFRALKQLADVNTTEQLLLYHAVPGETITYRRLRASGGEKLQTAAGEGKILVVRVRNNRVRLVDLDPDDANARVIPDLKNLNKGNRQIAHGINRVLRPIELP
jgi:uncharacterized surface protein with fasciclin (FAS1) repeats